VSDYNQLFFYENDINIDKVQNIVKDSLAPMDDGELFLEYCISESIVLDERQIKNISSDVNSGFGLRGIKGELTAYAHSSEISLKELYKASSVINSINNIEGQGKFNIKIKPKAHNLYTNFNPLETLSLQEKILLLQKVDDYVRSKNNKVKQVSASLFGEWQVVKIIRPEEEILTDIRPLIRFNVSVYLESDGRMESGSYGVGGRKAYLDYVGNNNWMTYADEALRQAESSLLGKEAPAGEMQVVLGSGWPGVLLHEAVGHGLEGDFNRKETSTFSNSIGKKVAADGVTVIDNGTMPDRRGSLNIDDEGTPTNENVLIENGVLKGYMQDRINAKLMNQNLTGNGRRENYEYPPMPRMTNTYMLPGTVLVEDMISSVKKGIYAVNFSGGQVDITSGKFVFSASEAYLIENGKISYPIKGATLIGNGPDVMKKIVAIGNDLALDPGIGTCGKDGQSVPVGVGQPSLLINSMTVGGTQI
jgi:TldD protein